MASKRFLIAPELSSCREYVFALLLCMDHRVGDAVQFVYVHCSCPLRYFMSSASAGNASAFEPFPENAPPAVETYVEIVRGRPRG